MLLFVNILILHQLLVFTGFQPNGQAPISSTDKPFTQQIQAISIDVPQFTPPRRLRTDEIPHVVNDCRILQGMLWKLVGFLSNIEALKCLCFRVTELITNQLITHLMVIDIHSHEYM